MHKRAKKLVQQNTREAMNIGYARTSSVEQEAGLEAQIRDLKAQGVSDEHIFAEQVSSMDAERPKLKEVLRFVRKGDILIVTKLDRLARSILHYAEIQAGLEKKGVALRILNLGLDTSNPTGRLVHNTLMAVAQYEREIMLERQREGIAKAKAEKNYWGRKPTAREKADEVKRLKAEGLGASAIAGRLGIARRSVYNILNDKPEDAETFKHRAKVWNNRKSAA